MHSNVPIPPELMPRPEMSLKADKGQVYEEVIDKMIMIADDCLALAAGSEGDKDVLTKLVGNLYSLTEAARQFSLVACVGHAALRGNVGYVNRVFNHPILQIITMYLATCVNSAVYLNWNVEVYPRRKWLVLPIPPYIRIVHEFSTERPS